MVAWQRRWQGPLVAMLAGTVGVPTDGLGAAPSADPSAAKITGVYFNGYLRGDPEPEEAIRIRNTDRQRVLDLGDFALTDRFGPRRPARGRRGRKRSTRHEEATAALEDALDDDSEADAQDVTDPQMMMVPNVPTASVRLPQGTRVPPGGEVWVAFRADEFHRVFGFPPAVEGVNTDPRVPDGFLSPSWLNLGEHQGVLALSGPDGRVVDLVAWDSKRPKLKPLSLSRIPDGMWTGPAVMLTDSSPYSYKGQVLARDRDESGNVLPDTDTAEDWDSGFSRKQLGTEPTHRIEFPGQTHLVSRPLVGVKGRVTCGSSPENQFALLTEAMDSARERIRINVYQLTNPHVADHIHAALKRGVKVTMLMEGTPVGGIPDVERVLLDELATAGAKVMFLGDRKGRKDAVKPRYRFDHAKYTLIDDRVAIIGTENYGGTGHPPDPSRGNRGFEVAIEQPQLVAQLAEVFELDTEPDHQDLIGIHDDATDTYGLPTRDPNFKVDRTIHKGLYPERRKPLVVEGKMDLELVMSPDTSLNETSSILGMIARARQEVLVLQNSIPRYWGRGGKLKDLTPNLGLAAVVAAARRGVMVRVLLDGTWYNAEDSDPRDNDDTARFLNELAQKEGLNLYAKVINLETAHLEKIHAKSVMVDGQEVLVSSINWSENSFKGNREMGIIIRHPEVTGYYRELFWRDWRASRLYRVALRSKDATLHSEPRLGAPSLRRITRGQWMDVVTEVARGTGRGEGFLEVPLDGGMSGYLRVNQAGEHLALPGETRALYGREMNVEGRVLEVMEKGKVLVLGLDKPDGAVFEVVFFNKMRERYKQETGKDPVEALRGRRVVVRGTISRFHGPQIQIQKSGQIRVLGDEPLLPK